MTVRLYLDAVPVIYTVEQVPLFAAAVDARLSAAEVVQVISDLTRMECRVKPLRDGNSDLLKDYDDYFEGAIAEIVALSRVRSWTAPRRFVPNMDLRRLMLSTLPRQ
jgi:hypothetical protein